MKRRLYEWMTVISASLLMISLISGCSSHSGKPVSADFTQYVSAYTAGLIQDGGAIRIEFVSDIEGAEPGKDVPKGLLSISPKVSGKAVWTSKNALEFVPDENSMVRGKEYTVSVALDKLFQISDKALRRMEFGIMAARRQARIRITDMIITESNPDVVDIAGEIEFNCSMSIEDVRKHTEWSLAAKSEGAAISISEETPSTFSFRTENISKSERENLFTISFKGASKDFESKEEASIIIPAKGTFEVVRAQLYLESDPRIEVIFSDIPGSSGTDKGMVTVEGGTDEKVATSGNKATVWFNSRRTDEHILHVAEGVRSATGKALGMEYTESFRISSAFPAVEFPFSGNILPDPSRLVLPFRAVNLRAVDVRVIKIYTDNIMSFLQENDLDGSIGLRRSGRLVYKGQIRLDTDPSKDLGEWQDFSVDLSGLFKQESGAIYRVRFLFNRDYYIGFKGDGKKSDESSRQPSWASGGMGEDLTSDAYWDITEPYVWEDSGIYDWNEYEWNDIDDPTKPSFYMEGNRFPARNIMTSTLGIIAKSSDSSEMDIFVNDILSTKPVSGAKVKVYDYQLQEAGSGSTDGDGHVRIDASHKAFIVTAEHSGSKTYLRVADGDENLLSRFDVGGAKIENGLKGFVYGERGVWRPGDTLHLTLVVEDPMKLFPEAHPATMEVYTALGQLHTRKVAASNVNGFYTFSIPTAESDPTGNWNAYFKVGGATFHKSLLVETVKPNRLKVKLSVPDVIDGPEAFNYSIESSWLTGPAASGLRYEMEMTLRDGSSLLAKKSKSLDGYTFKNPLSSFSTSEIDIAEGTLNASGKASGRVDRSKTISQAPGLLAASVVSRVFEQGGDESFSLTETLYSPYKVYVGVKPEAGDFLETDKDHFFNVVTVDCNGKAVDKRSLDYTIYKLDWSWWWESDASSLDSYVNGSSAKIHSSGRIACGTSGAKIPFRIDYPEWGRFLILVKDSQSGHMSGLTFVADWPEWRGRSSKSDPSALTMVTFSTDKKSYEVGEEATVYIPAAAEGSRALVSLEGAAGVISSTWVKTAKGNETPYRFRITKDMAPNFHIHLTLLQPHGQTGNDLPVRMYGVQPVEVTSKESHLKPVISMPDAVRPLEPFTIKVKEASGKPMTYTLAIVDEGLLDLTGFKTPDIWGAMNRRLALGVKTWDMYDDVAGAFSGRFSPMYSIGGDEAVIKGSRKESRFNPVVKVLGPFTVAKGEQSHKITLPMYVGSVRVMVVAGQDRAYGSAEKAVPVRTPVMVLPTLPRKVSVGESFKLPVNVFVMEDNVRKVNVKVSVEGPVKLVSESAKDIEFSGSGDTMTSFELKAAGSEGQAKVTVSATGGSYTAKETIYLDVTNPNPVIIRSVAGFIEGGKSITLPYTPASEGGVEAILEAASYPTIDLDGCYSFMENYPHLCGEQICARGIAFVALRDMLSDEKAAKVDALIPEMLGNLYSRQLGNGGFVLWQGQNVADPWVSSMAGHFMALATAQGYSVNQDVLNSWADFQRKEARSYRRTDSKYADGYDVAQAYRLYTLALNGKAQDAAMNRMRETASLTETAKWLLASAYALSGKKQIAQSIVGEIMDAGSKPESGSGVWGVTYGSPARDKAIAVEALVLAERSAQALNMSRELADEFHGSSYYTTQSTAFAAAAISRLAEKMGDNIVSIELGEGRRKAVERKDRSFVSASLDLNEKSVEIRNTADNAVYLNVISKFRQPAGQKVEAAQDDISMSVSYLGADGKSIDTRQIAQGTDFSINVKVSGLSSADAGRNMVLTIPAASGWEIFNDRLYGTAAQTDADYIDYRDDRVNIYFSLASGSSASFKVRVRASYQGEFTLPAISCEDMYHPDVHANTGSGITIVR
ncbi:MAG: MG2 domain-containing protein [Bacteroidales bacterium]|nr:MG2 domain-containing protein [Bacteroidales bacterium]